MRANAAVCLRARPKSEIAAKGRTRNNPVEIQKVNLRAVPGSNPGGFQFGLDPSGRFLHVVSQQDSPTSTVQANALFTLKVGADGTLTEVPSSPIVLPVPNLTRPQGVVAF